MESNIFSTSSEGGHPRGGPTSKKRKLTMNKSENQYEAEIVKLKQEIQECQQELGKQIVKIARLEKEKDDSSCELDDIDMEETKAKEEEFKSKIALLQQQIEDERTTYETKLAEYKSTGSAQKIKELEVELEAKVYTQSSLRNTIEDIQKSNAEKEKILQNKINEMQSKCGDSDKKIKGLQTQLESKTKNDLKNNEEMGKQYENQKKLLNSSVEERNKKVKDLEIQLESKTKEASIFQEQVSKLEAAQKDIVNKNVHLKEIQNLKEKHEKEVKDMKAKLGLAVEKAEAEISGLKANTEDLTKNLSNEKQALIRLRSKIKEFKDTYAVAKQKLIDDVTKIGHDTRAKISEQEKKIKELEVELVSKVSAESSLRKTIEDTQKSNAEKEKLSQNKINEIQSKCDDSDKKIKGLQTQLESKTKEAFTFQEKVSKLEAAQKDSIDKNIHLKEMQSLKEKHEKEVKAKNEKAEAEINRLKADTEDLAKQLYNGKQTVLRLQSEIREFNDELTDSKSNEEKLKSNIAHLRSTCVNIAEYDKKIEELKTKKLPFYLAMDEIRDGSARDRLGSNTVVEVTKLAYSSGCLNLFSTFEPFEKPFKFKLSNEKPYFKIQINDELEIKSDADKGLSDTLSFIHSCNLTKLDYGRTCINYTDFIKLVSSHTITSFIGGNVVREINGKIKVFVGIAEILKELPNIETCEIHFSSSPDCQKLDELPIFSNLQKFSLHLSNRSMFNIEAFAEFIKKHQNVKFFFKYNSISRTDKKKTETQEKQLRESLPSECKVVFEY